MLRGIFYFPFGVARIRHCSTKAAARLQRKYEDAKGTSEQQAQSQHFVDPRAVFANSELDLSKIGVYGFDYDYTLAVYTKELNILIYSLALNSLIKNYKYPDAIREIPYYPEFAVRGLHFDMRRGILMKLDAFLGIQEGTMYRGMKPVSRKEINRQYPGYRIPSKYLDEGHPYYLRQLSDLFSLPEVGLLATVIEYFEQNSINYDTLALFYDVQAAISNVHISGLMYQRISANPARYIHENVGLRDFFARLVANQKTVFIMTNSPFHFIDAGMRYLIGDDWRNLFHYVIVNAKKPRFFEDNQKPFRKFKIDEGIESFERVSDLEKGQVYTGGNLNDFVQKTGIYPRRVLYFGDHIQTDLNDPMMKYGWATGAIVPELSREITTQNRYDYRKALAVMNAMTDLIESEQGTSSNSDIQTMIDAWFEEREEARMKMKVMFNPQFGSIFRTWYTPTYFSHRLMRLADIYTDRVPNMLQYNINHYFYPQRSPLPHEAHSGNPATNGYPSWASG